MPKNVKFILKTDDSWSDDSKSIQLSSERVTSSLKLYKNFIKDESDSFSSSNSKSEESESVSNSINDENDVDDLSELDEWNSCPKVIFCFNYYIICSFLL